MKKITLKRKKKEVVVETVAEKPKIELLEINLGRDDLNVLVSKINEIIKHVS